jgi:hypothetical protein
MGDNFWFLVNFEDRIFAFFYWCVCVRVRARARTCPELKYEHTGTPTELLILRDFITSSLYSFLYTSTACLTDPSSHVTCVKFELKSYCVGIGFKETKVENMWAG